MQRAPFVLGSMVAAGAIAAGVVVLKDDNESNGAKSPEFEVVLAQDDGLQPVLAAGAHYRAAFVVEWKGGETDQRDGHIVVYASRQGDTSEDAPEGEWPVVCEQDFKDIVSVSRVPCQFQAPGPGLFALEIEVRSKLDNKLLGEGLYTHNVVDPETMESNED